MENLFDKVNEEDYYKPILGKSSFKDNYKYYESWGDNGKRLSVKQYLKKFRPHLYDLINDHRIVGRMWKIQISMRVCFISSKVTGKILFIYGVGTKALCGVATQMILLENFLGFFT